MISGINVLVLHPGHRAALPPRRPLQYRRLREQVSLAFALCLTQREKTQLHSFLKKNRWRTRVFLRTNLRLCFRKSHLTSETQQDWQHKQGTGVTGKRLEDVSMTAVKRKSVMTVGERRASSKTKVRITVSFTVTECRSKLHCQSQLANRKTEKLNLAVSRATL